METIRNFIPSNTSYQRLRLGQILSVQPSNIDVDERKKATEGLINT